MALKALADSFLPKSEKNVGMKELMKMYHGYNTYVNHQYKLLSVEILKHQHYQSKDILCITWKISTSSTMMKLK